jgi:hypothetical protein
MYANSRIGTVHFSQGGGGANDLNIPQATAGAAVKSEQNCSLRNRTRNVVTRLAPSISKGVPAITTRVCVRSRMSAPLERG